VPKPVPTAELEEVGAAIKEARRAREMTLHALAKASGVDSGNLSRLERGLQGFSMEALASICKGLRIPLADLFQIGRAGSRAVQLSAVIPMVSLDDVDSVATLHRLIHARQGSSIGTTARVGKGAFAFRMKGDAMLPRFPEGIIVVVDPGATPRAGSFVAAISNNTAVFKQLVIEPEKRYLRSIDRRYPLVELGKLDPILGTARQAIVELE
jgi:phage repressor protein C with HTH and peptisase S24 domain